jgi:hypothetical protein
MHLQIAAIKIVEPANDGLAATLGANAGGF